MIAWAPCMQWFVVPIPRRPPAVASRTSSAPRHFGCRSGMTKYSHTTGRAAVFHKPDLRLGRSEAAAGVHTKMRLFPLSRVRELLGPWLLCTAGDEPHDELKF